jgi:diguanylate cyclase (GGDEF)-like protein
MIPAERDRLFQDKQGRLGATLAVGIGARAARPVKGLRTRIRLIILIAGVCAAAWIAATTYVGVWRLDLMMDRRVGAAMQEAQVIAGVGAQAVVRRLDALRTIPELLADQERLGRRLAKFDVYSAMVPRHLWGDLLRREEMLDLSRELAASADNLNLEGIYLVSDKGFVIAASDGTEPGGHLASSFSGRDYFLEAMSGGKGEGFGVDPVSGAPMFFFANRVEMTPFHQGAVIVATSSARMLLPIERGLETIYLSDRGGVVVVASEPELLYRTVRDGALDGMGEDALKLRYGRTRFEPVAQESLDVEASLDGDDVSVHADLALPDEQMTLHVWAPLQDLNVARRENLNATLGLGLLGVMLTVVVTLALVQIASMRERATRDGLTGLANRRQADDVLPELMELDDRGRLAGIAVVSFDLDRFKKINDTWGHAVGDRVLRRFAQILMRSARRADLVFRYGGEEFLAVLVEQDITAATRFAERVRVATAAIDDMQPVPPATITVSAGAVMRNPGEPLDDVIARADALLYRAKNNGRNRVESDPD